MSTAASRRIKPSVLADRVAADRRQRAIMAILRDEQTELTEQLDDRFRELSEQGAIAVRRDKRGSTTAKATEEEEKGLQTKKGDGGHGDDDADHCSAPSSAYDQLYYDLQMLPPAMAVRSSTTAPQHIVNKDGRPQNDGEQHQQQQQPATTVPPLPPSNNASSTTVLDVGVALSNFLTCAASAAHGTIPMSDIAAKMDTLLRSQLRPALAKCPVAGPRHILDQLVEMRAEFCRSKRCRMEAPSFVQVSFLQMVAKLFPPDAAAAPRRFHPILMPTVAFASKLVGQTRIRSISQCARLIFLCAQMCEWFCATRPRYFPEVMAFLLGALQLCCESKIDEQNDSDEQRRQQQPFPTMNFPISLPHRQMLFVGPPKEQQRNDAGDLSSGRLSLQQIFMSQNCAETDDSGMGAAENDADEEMCATGVAAADNGTANAQHQPVNQHILRLSTIRTLLHTIGQYARKYGGTADGDAAEQRQQHSGGDVDAVAVLQPAFNAIFGPFHCLSLRLPLANYPPQLADEAAQFIQLLAKLMEQNAPVTQMKRYANSGSGLTKKPIRMLEPRFEERFNPERPFKHAKNGGGPKGAEKNWARRAKKERRGALKMLRKDALELASAYGDRQRKVRRERDEKTKRIMQSLEVQESEHKKLKLIKKK